MWLLIEVEKHEDVGKNELNRIKVHHVEIGKARIPPIDFSGYGTWVHPATER